MVEWVELKHQDFIEEGIKKYTENENKQKSNDELKIEDAIMLLKDNGYNVLKKRTKKVG